jgi:hypothetical protein
LAHGSAIRAAGWTELDPEITIADTVIPEVEVGQELQVAQVELSGLNQLRHRRSFRAMDPLSPPEAYLAGLELPCALHNLRNSVGRFFA